MKAYACFALCLTAAAPAGGPLSDAEIRQRIIQESIAAFPGPAPCPYSVLRNGRTAGTRSHYSRPGGYSPKCYPHDVSDAEVRAWREGHR